MPANSSDAALALAGQLSSLTDAGLAELLGAREIRESGIRDFFDLAEALLDPVSIQHALGRLDRPTLTSLAALSELGGGTATTVAARLTDLGVDTTGIRAQLATAVQMALVTDHGGLYAVPASVGRQLESWPNMDLPGLDELATAPAPTALAPVSLVDARLTDHVAAERAFATTTAIAELLAALHHESARELARGGIALPDSKRLANAMAIGLDQVAELLEIAARAGLIALDAGRWVPSSSSSEWVVDSSGERWSLLAAAWLDRLPADIRSVLALRAHAGWGERLEEYVSWLFPAGGEWMRERVLVYTRDAELLGITADHAPSSPGIALLTEGATAAGPLMAALFPREIEQVYLQHDLSVVSPGPLSPRIDARLRTMADVEGRALASTYRISPASLYRAMAVGETEPSIRAFLAGISLSGIPQPLDYLIAEASARYGLVRVGALDDDLARSYVRSTDTTLLRTMLVDHSLGALALTRSGDRLVSRFAQDIVFWTLSEARYPVAAENAAGEVVVLSRGQTPGPGGAVAGDGTRNLVEKLRLGSSADPEVTGKAWLSRQLDVAIRAKAAVIVTVELPSGATASYHLEPASVAGGRLRARDRKADIERTLPLSSITAISPAE